MNYLVSLHCSRWSMLHHCLTGNIFAATAHMDTTPKKPPFLPRRLYGEASGCIALKRAEREFIEKWVFGGCQPVSGVKRFFALFIPKYQLHKLSAKVEGFLRVDLILRSWDSAKSMEQVAWINKTFLSQCFSGFRESKEIAGRVTIINQSSLGWEKP